MSDAATDATPGPAMTAEEFRLIGLRAWGRPYQAAVARLLKVDPRTVRRWARDEVEIMPERAAAIRAAAENKGKALDFARERLDQLMRDADAAGLARNEVLGELAERALLLSSIATLATRRPKAKAA